MTETDAVLASLYHAQADLEAAIALLEADTPPSGSVVHVTTAAELVEALATVVGPAEIRIAPGEYRGNFLLRARDDTGLVTLRANLDDTVITPIAPSPWITPAQAAAFPKLGVLDPGAPILTTANGAHDWTLCGLEFLPNTARPDYTLVELGRGDEATREAIPSRLQLASCYVHGDPIVGCRRGVSFHAYQSQIRQCYISECWYQGQDSQAIGSWGARGELLIEDNYLEASGENVIFGGSDPRIADLVPEGITIRGNYVYKPQAWRERPGSVKNLFELKSARRVLVEANVFEGCWVDGQSGHAIVFTVRNQDGGAPWSTVAEVVFRWNVVKECEGAFFNLLGLDDLYPSVRGQDIRIEQNLCLDGGGGVQSISGYHRTTVQHNIMTGPYWKWLAFSGEPCSDFVWLDNAEPPTEYGITGDDQGIGTPSLEYYAPGAELRANSIGMRSQIPYPPDNYLLPDGTPPADYLAQAASDGGQVGVDLAELQRRIPWYPIPGRAHHVARPAPPREPVPFGLR